MSKKYFDLGARYNDPFMDLWDFYRSGKKQNREDLCDLPYLICYKSHESWTCERKKLLEEFMWTRSR